MKTMKKIIIVLLCCVWNSGFLSAQVDLEEYAALSIPGELIKNASEVVRQDYMKLEIQNTRSAILHRKYVVTLLNDDSREHQQYVGYDKFRKINKLSARVYDASGKLVRKVKSKEFNDRSSISGFSIYEDDRMKTIELHHSSFPYTIELEYEISYKNFPFYPAGSLQSFEKSVENFEYVIETPADFKLRHLSRNTDIKPMITKTGDKITYAWKAARLPALIWEPHAPYTDKIVPRIEIAPTEFHFDKYPGTASDWNTLGKFIYELNKDRDKISPDLAAKVREITANAQTNEEKISILYNYLQQNTRYVSVQLGIGGWQTFDAEYVEKNKYGDCKALSNFMKSMLKEIGIDAYQTLIYHSRWDKAEMLEEFATFNFANHVILNIPSEDIWLECTSSDAPPNYLGYANHDRQVLMLSEEGGKIIRTPDFSLEENKQINHANINIDQQGGAVIKQKIKCTGPKHDRYRFMQNNLSPEDLEKRFLEHYDLSAFNIEQLLIESDDKKPECTINFDISVPRYSSKAGKRIFIPLNKLNPFDNVPREIKERIHPVHVKNQFREKDIYTFTLPEGYELESIPKKEINLESEFGKYQIHISVEGDQIKYDRLLEIYSVELPAEHYSDLRNFYKEVAKADTMKMVLVKKRP